MCLLADLPEFHEANTVASRHESINAPAVARVQHQRALKDRSETRAFYFIDDERQSAARQGAEQVKSLFVADEFTPRGRESVDQPLPHREQVAAATEQSEPSQYESHNTRTTRITTTYTKQPNCHTSLAGVGTKASPLRNAFAASGGHEPESIACNPTDRCCASARLAPKLNSFSPGVAKWPTLLRLCSHESEGGVIRVRGASPAPENAL